MSTLKVNPVMYLLVDPRVEMSAAKLAAQVAHGAVEAYKLSPDNRLKHIWDECGKHYAKVVLDGGDLQIAREYIEARGFKTVLIIDEGRTEFGGGLTPTVLGVQIVDKNAADVAATFGDFKLYRHKDPYPKACTKDGEKKRSFIDKCKERCRAHRSRRDPGGP